MFLGIVESHPIVVVFSTRVVRMEPTPSVIIEDIEFAIQFVESKLNPSFPIRGAFQSQLYCIIKNKSDVDEGVSKLRESKSFKLISCKHCGLDDIFIMRLSSYLQDIELYFANHIRSLDDSTSSSKPSSSSVTGLERSTGASLISCKDMYLSFISQSSCMSVNAGDLLDRSSVRDSVVTSTSSSRRSFSTSDVDLLVKLGFLTLRRLRDSFSAGDVYWVAHPQLGRLVGAIMGARSKLTTFIRSRKYKEIAEEELVHILAATDTSTGTGAGTGTGIDAEVHSVASKGAKRKRGDGWGNGGNTPQGAAAREACAGLGVRYCVLYLEGHEALLRVKTPAGKWILRLRES